MDEIENEHLTLLLLCVLSHIHTNSHCAVPCPGHLSVAYQLDRKNEVALEQDCWIGSVAGVCVGGLSSHGALNGLLW